MIRGALRFSRATKKRQEEERFTEKSSRLNSNHELSVFCAPIVSRALFGAPNSNFYHVQGGSERGHSRVQSLHQRAHATKFTYLYCTDGEKERKTFSSHHEVIGKREEKEKQTRHISFSAEVVCMPKMGSRLCLGSLLSSSFSGTFSLFFVFLAIG